MGYHGGRRCFGRLLSYREKEGKVCYEARSRGGRGHAQRRLPPEAGESGGDPAQSSDDRRPPVLEIGKTALW
jgi:hypothetical protein